MINRRNAAVVERLEQRRLLAVNWGASAKLMDQNAAAAAYPNITGAGVTVAIMDTGVNYNHPALGGGFGPGHKVKAGWDFADNDPDPMDTFGHGTNNAGIIAANGFMVGSDYYQGVAPGASLVALRIARGGEAVSDATILAALQWIENNYVAQGISIVNFSFGAGTYASDHTEPQVSAEFKKLADLGILFTSPAGNNGIAGGAGVNWPAADPSVAAIGSVGLNDNIASFSQRGSTLDLLAPGENLGTTNVNGTTGLVTFTSYSSPVVAGAAALLKQADPTLRAKDMLSILRASGARKDDNSFGTHASYSRVDLDNAIALAFARKPNAATDVGVAGAANDLAYDRDGVLHFAYYDPRIHNIKYATRSTSGVWSGTRVIDVSGDDAGATLSLAIDPTGKPAIAYYNATVGDLDYARFDGKAWKRSTIDSKKIVGQSPSLAFDTTGNPVVAYYRKTSGDLRVMRHDGTQWVRYDVDVAGDTGHSPSLAVSKNGTMGVAYGDATTGDLKYAQFNGSSWTPETIDDLRGAAFISLAYNATSQPAISYYDAYPADLKFASKASGAWATSRVSSKGAVGLFTNLYFDKNNAANIIYYSRKSNATFRLIGSIGSWTAQTLTLLGGRDVNAAGTVDGSAGSYSWWNEGKQKLYTGDVIS